jgi:hypothetical protein
MYNNSSKVNAGLAVLAFTLMSAICGHTKQGDQPPPPQNTRLLKIISDADIWEKNLLPAIAQAEALEKSGEKYIEIFPSALVSGDRFLPGDKSKTDERISRYNAALAEAEKSDLYQQLNRSKPFTNVAGKANVYRLTETDSVGVGLVFDRDNYLFRPTTKIATVFKKLGKPEQTSTRVLHGPGEERPQILTLYSYENGIIMFAEADIAAEPGLLNRVFIDVPRFVKALKNEIR